jgi:hypothetical protein
VSEIQMVGHGQPDGFHLRGINADAEGWIRADEIRQMVDWTGARDAHRQVEIVFRACYTDVLARDLGPVLRRAGYSDSVVRGIAGAFQPNYGPTDPRTTSNRRTWGVQAPEPTVPPPNPLQPGDLRGL